jgi:manganese transport protein
VNMTVGNWLQSAGPARGWLELGLFPVLVLLGLLLAWITFQPVLPGWFRRFGRAPVQLPQQVAVDLPSPSYTKILVPLDHSDKDREAIAHAAAMAKQHHATLYLLHVEEDVTSQVYGPEASTAEVEAGEKYLRQIASQLEEEQVAVQMVVRYSRNPKKEIVRFAVELQPDLVVMGAHGHKGLKDIIFGTTINAVRHKLKVPLLIVRGNR